MICDDVPVRFDIRRMGLRGLRGLRVEGQLIKIVTTPCNFGGERRWFLCPGCQRRCAILYIGLRCRLCIGGRYRCELKAPVDRMIFRARKLRRQLGQGDPSASNPIPPKPHRMHWRTYHRIRNDITRLEYESLRIFAGRIFGSLNTNGPKHCEVVPENWTLT